MGWAGLGTFSLYNQWTLFVLLLLVLHAGMYVGVGGAVTSQSSTQDEQEEMMLKAKLLLETISAMNAEMTKDK